MDAVTLNDEIKDLLAEDKIDPEAATRLILVTQQEILNRMTELEGLTSANCEYIARYPSFTWLWMHRRKGTALVVVVVFLGLYFALTPITISDWRPALYLSHRACQRWQAFVGDCRCHWRLYGIKYRCK